MIIFALKKKKTDKTKISFAHLPSVLFCLLLLIIFFLSVFLIFFCLCIYLCVYRMGSPVLGMHTFFFNHSSLFADSHAVPRNRPSFYLVTWRCFVAPPRSVGFRFLLSQFDLLLVSYSKALQTSKLFEVAFGTEIGKILNYKLDSLLFIVIYKVQLLNSWWKPCFRKLFSFLFKWCMTYMMFLSSTINEKLFSRSFLL